MIKFCFNYMNMHFHSLIYNDIDLSFTHQLMHAMLLVAEYLCVCNISIYPSGIKNW